MKILVTGAAGFIGSHLAQRLASMGHEVLGLDCFSEYYSTRLKRLNAEDVGADGVKILELDLAVDDLSAAVDGIEVVYHCAAQPGISATTSFEDYLRNNVIATERLLQAVKGRSSLKCFVNIATSSIYGAHAADSEETAPKPTSYYGVTKLAAEQLAMAYHREGGLPACSLRLFSVYGPRERPEKLYTKLIASILKGTQFPLYEGAIAHLRSFTYVGDIIDACEAVLANIDRCIGEIFNIGWDKQSTTAEAIAAVEEAVGSKARIVTVPARPGDQLRTCANIDKARRVLGYNPKIDLRTGLVWQVEWYRSRVLPLGL